MEPIRTDLIAAAQSLLRLAIRVRAKLSTASHLESDRLRVRDLVPMSEWIDTVDPMNALGSIEVRAVEVSEHLLALARGADPIDPRYAVMVMQAVCGEASQFSTRARRFAERHGIGLAEYVRDEAGASIARQDVMRAVNRIAGIW